MSGRKKALGSMAFLGVGFKQTLVGFIFVVILLSGAGDGAVRTSSGEIPPLYFFYAIHVHAAGDHLPYDSPALRTLNPQVAQNMLAQIEGIAGVLEKYGAKGTWEVVYGTAQGLCAFEGEDHVFQRLLEAGHEVGLHVHRYADYERDWSALRDACGITPTVTSGLVTDANFDRLRELFDAALRYMEENRPERVAAWGFVTHIHEYAVGTKGENPPSPEALAALDRFLAYVAEKAAEDRVIFATAGEIARATFP